MTFTDVLSQPAYPGAKPEEVAEVFIDKFVYSDWETVWVQHRWHDAWPIFRITTAERDPVAELWARLQIIPGDLCLIKLGGVVAITGVVTVRQTAYDANSHAVSIQGMGVQWFTWRGAILDKTQEFKGGYVDVATQVMAPFGVTPTVIGTIDPTEFKPPAHNEIGESVFQFLEKLGRERKVVLGGDYAGNLLLVGDHESQVVDELIEGVNIQDLPMRDQYRRCLSALCRARAVVAVGRGVAGGCGAAGSLRQLQGPKAILAAARRERAPGLDAA